MNEEHDQCSFLHIQIVFISVALSCIFRQLARDEIATVAPFTPGETANCSSNHGKSHHLPLPL